MFAYVPRAKRSKTLRKIAVTLSVLAAAATISAPAQAAQQPPDVKEILDDLIVCVMAPCP